MQGVLLVLYKYMVVSLDSWAAYEMRVQDQNKDCGEVN